jgi:MoaA/NifB/PqqE/SkfB family radical SAM enzyme
MVHLQGWGEPFLHPDFLEMVSLAKKAGCAVGTTTNGMLLRRPMLERIVDSGLDVIAFSLAGTGEDNDRVRIGTSISAVLETILSLQDLKRRRRVASPSVHIAFMLLRSGFDKCNRLLEILEGHGISQVVISTLDFVGSEGLAAEALRPESDAEYAAISSRLQDVVTALARRGMEGHFRLVSPGRRRPVCTENVQRALFLSTNGSVSPCVFLNIPADIDTETEGSAVISCTHRTFGNVNQTPFPDIWKSKEYERFRRSFASDDVAGFCRTCPKLHEV